MESTAFITVISSSRRVVFFKGKIHDSNRDVGSELTDIGRLNLHVSDVSALDCTEVHCDGMTLSKVAYIAIIRRLIRRQHTLACERQIQEMPRPARSALN